MTGSAGRRRASEKIPVVLNEEMAEEFQHLQTSSHARNVKCEDPPLRHVPIGHVRRHERKAQTPGVLIR